MEICLEDVEDNHTPAKLYNRAPKQYTYSQDQMNLQKNCNRSTKSIKNGKKNTKITYFDQIIKNQNKKMFINNFIRKVKRTIVSRSPIQHPSLHLHDIQNQQFSKVQIPVFIGLAYSIIQFIVIGFLLIMVSLSLVFQQFHSLQIYKISIYIGFSFHIIQIIKSIISNNISMKRINENILNIFSVFTQKEGFIDLVVFIAFFIQIVVDQDYNLLIIRFIFLFKFLKMIQILDFFQLSSFQNAFWQQVWALIKLVFVNYIVAHIIGLILISMAQINSQHNWMTEKQIYNKSQIQQYIWAYYWATTIMLTVGFGDIAPVSTQQAFCLIFIQTISCMLLAYNINKVGIIFEKIQSYSHEQKFNLKIFQQVTQYNKISSDLSKKIVNYIKQSVVIKKSTNIEEQNKFVQSLPISFKIDLLRQCHRPLWSDLLFFKNLTQKTILQLSIRLQKKMGHPEQVIHSYKDPANLFILRAGQVAYTYYRQSNRNLESNGKTIQSFKMKNNQLKILTLNFLFHGFFPFDVKCLDYVVLYKMKKQDFLQILKQNIYDYQYYCMVQDKDKYLLNEFQVDLCEICQNQKHTLDKCPKIHFVPLKQHIIRKFLAQKLSQNLKMKLKKERRQYQNYKTLRNIQKFQISVNLSRQAFNLYIQKTKKPNFAYQYIQSSITPKLQQQKTLLNICSFKSFDDNYISKQKGPVLIQEAALKIKNEFQKVFQLNVHKQLMWNVQTDILCDFKYYFKKYNPENLCILLKRKQKIEKINLNMEVKSMSKF